MQTSQTKLRRPAVFNPAMQSSEEIVANFVVRLGEFNELIHALETDRMEKPPQHYLIQGQRGYGKTTLLLRLKIEIIRDADLNAWLIPIMFDEEQYHIRSLAGLWEEVIRILEEEDEAFAGLPAEIEALYDMSDPEGEIYRLLISALKEKKKKLVLLLDNFGDMIGKFTRKENQRLREVLITSDDIRLIGASSTVLEFYYNYKEPFFDFFKVITLDELNREETISLLAKLGETYKADEIDKIIEEQPQRIDALRRLTGGVPRTILLLFEIFVDDADGNSVKDLEMALDKVTPLYKHRLDNLSAQQQVIIDAIAQNWDAVSTKEIAAKVRMPSKAVSAQLNQLEKNQLIRKISTSTKNHLYQISERFFNIYYLMRLGRKKSKNRVLWLVRFFEICCTEEDLRLRTQKHIQAIREARLYDKHAYMISQALSETTISLELQSEQKKNRERALELQEQAYNESKNLNKANGYITILLWNNEIDKAVKLYREFFDQEILQKEVNSVIISVLLQFLAKKQYHFLYGLFKENKYDIRDKYKPVYYALLSLMGDRYADELKKMGDELKESVQDVLKAVERYRISFST